MNDIGIQREPNNTGDQDSLNNIRHKKGDWSLETHRLGTLVLWGQYHAAPVPTLKHPFGDVAGDIPQSTPFWWFGWQQPWTNAAVWCLERASNWHWFHAIQQLICWTSLNQDFSELVGQICSVQEQSIHEPRAWLRPFRLHRSEVSASSPKNTQVDKAINPSPDYFFHLHMLQKTPKRVDRSCLGPAMCSEAQRFGWENLRLKRWCFSMAKFPLTHRSFL